MWKIFASKETVLFALIIVSENWFVFIKLKPLSP